MMRLNRYRLLAVLWTLAIFIGCSLPGVEFPEAPVVQTDKLLHFGAFFGFGWLWMLALRHRPARHWWVLAGGILFGVFTEVYQGIMPLGRLFDPFDALADAVGVLAAVLVLLWHDSEHEGS